jgi:hypothetical protein
MPAQLPRKSKTPAQEAFETLAFLWGGVAVAAFFGWQYKVPGVYPLVQRINDAVSQYTLPLLQRTFGQVNPTLERLFIRDLIRRGEREGRKIEAVREKIQVKAAKKDHAR